MPPSTNPIRTVLVDTSLLVEQQKGPERSSPVRRALSQYPFQGATSYAKLEFKRAWLKRLAWLYNSTNREDVGSISLLINLIDQTFGKHPLQRRTYQTLMQALAAFLTPNNDRLTDAERFVRLRAHIKQSLRGS